MPVNVLTRTEKGTQLTTAEVDQNFTDLQDAVNIARTETVTETSVTVTASTKRAIMADCSANDITVTLPPAASALDEIYYIKKVDSTTNTVTIQGDGGETIDNDTHQTIRDQYVALAMISDGAEWFTLSKKSNAPTTLGVKTDTTTVTNTTTETLIYSYTFDANSFAPHEKVSSYVSGAYSNAGNTDEFTVTVKLNGNVMHTLQQVATKASTNAGWTVDVKGTIRTIGATGTYVDIALLHDGVGIFAEGTPSEVTIDTTVPLVYEIFIQWNNADAGNIFHCTQGNITTIR